MGKQNASKASMRDEHEELIKLNDTSLFNEWWWWRFFMYVHCHPNYGILSTWYVIYLN